MRASLKQRRGFTIIEILVVMGIIALGTLLIVPAFDSLASTKLKNASLELARLMRSTYADAALSGSTFRIVFELKTDEETGQKTSTYWVESFKGDAKGDELIKDEDEGARFIDASEREKRKYLPKPEFSPLKDKNGEKRQFPGTVRIFGAWVEGMPERLREGTVYLYFFPMGYTQKAQISLTDDDEGNNLLILVTEPLTGEVAIENAEAPVK